MKAKLLLLQGELPQVKLLLAGVLTKRADEYTEMADEYTEMADKYTKRADFCQAWKLELESQKTVNLLELKSVGCSCLDFLLQELARKLREKTEDTHLL